MSVTQIATSVVHASSSFERCSTPNRFLRSMSVWNTVAVILSVGSLIYLAWR